MRRSFAAVAGAILVVALCALSVNQGAMRAVAMLGDAAAYDRENLRAYAGFYGLAEGSPEYVQLERVVMALSAKVSDFAGITLVHIVPGALMLALMPLQLWRGLRERHRLLHRWTGRAILVLGAFFAAGAILLGVLHPVGGATEGSATVVFGGLFVVAGLRGYGAIRRGDAASHREWMLRMVGIAVGASVIRLMAAAGILLLGPGAVTTRSFGVLFWSGFLVASLAMELWILRARSRRAPESDHALQPL
jgi:hypothetical protein